MTTATSSRLASYWQDEGRRNAFILAICWALFISAISIDLAFDTLVGYKLAPSRSLATLPYALITVAGGAVTFFASYLMHRIGRRHGFVIGALAGVIGGGVSVWSVLHSNFWVFCAGTSAVGVFQAFAQYYRLAAADSVPPLAKSGAISTVLAGGVIAALLGPELGSLTKNLVGSKLFAGAYLTVTLLCVASVVILLLFYRDMAVHEQPATTTDSTAPRPTAEILMQPSFLAAVFSIVSGSAVMMFIMTAAPLATVHAHHSVDDGAHIISWHLVAMYAPSLVAARLIGRFGLASVLLCGVALNGLCIAVAVTSQTLAAFYFALICLGVAWNFLFVGGTTLLTRSYRPSELAKAQGLSELLRYGVTACAVGAAGPLLVSAGWSAVNLASLPGLVAAGAAMLYWLASERRATGLVPAED
jgi:MFS family permease